MAGKDNLDLTGEGGRDNEEATKSTISVWVYILFK